MSHPVSTGLPRFGEVIRDTERLLQQALAVLARDVDPASKPDVVAWPEVSDIRCHELHLGYAAELIMQALLQVQHAARDAPPAGSAVPVKFPDPERWLP